MWCDVLRWCKRHVSAAMRTTSMGASASDSFRPHQLASLMPASIMYTSRRRGLARLRAALVSVTAKGITYASSAAHTATGRFSFSVRVGSHCGVRESLIATGYFGGGCRWKTEFSGLFQRFQFFLS